MNIKKATRILVLMAGVFPLLSNSATLPRSGSASEWFACQKSYQPANVAAVVGVIHIEGTQTPSGEGSYKLEANCARVFDSGANFIQYYAEANAHYDPVSDKATENVKLYLGPKGQSGQPYLTISSIHSCDRDPFVDHAGPDAQCWLNTVGTTGTNLPSGYQLPVFVPFLRRKIGTGVVQQVSGEAPPPPPEPQKKNPLAGLIESTPSSSAPILTSALKRIQIASPTPNQLIQGNDVKFQVKESSLKKVDGSWKFNPVACCEYEIQYQYQPELNTQLKVPPLWVTVTQGGNSAQYLSSGFVISRQPLSVIAIQALQDRAGSGPAIAYLDEGGKAKGKWRWRVTTEMRDSGPNPYNSEWREFQILDVGDPASGGLPSQINPAPAPDRKPASGSPSIQPRGGFKPRGSQELNPSASDRSSQQAPSGSSSQPAGTPSPRRPDGSESGVSPVIGIQPEPNQPASREPAQRNTPDRESMPSR